jgi:hypothetical protein
MSKLDLLSSRTDRISVADPEPSTVSAAVRSDAVMGAGAMGYRPAIAVQITLRTRRGPLKVTHTSQSCCGASASDRVRHSSLNATSQI